MKALVFNYRCGKCNTVTKAPGVSDMIYGEFIMFNGINDSVCLNSFKDNVFDEFEALFKKEVENFKSINKRNMINIFQALFSIACDVSPDGSQHTMNSFPACKICGSKKMAS